MMLETAIKNIAMKIPGIQRIVRQRDHLLLEKDRLLAETARLGNELTALRKASGFVPPGHFYSPIPQTEGIRKSEQAIWGDIPRFLPGIDLHEAKQLALLGELEGFYPELPFTAEKSGHMRYFYENPMYSYSDAICLYGMIRHAKPRRIVEIGSGYSSCVMLDTSERHFHGSIKMTFIEPFPEPLLSLIREEDRERITLVEKSLQDVESAIFRSLEAGDILFIDSTHVSKIHSDVNHIFFRILPSLEPGVLVHFHDIFHPFEYPKPWVYEGRAWNEAYLLRGFLQYNESFEIVLFNTFLEHFHRQRFEKNMPLCLRNPGGSIWIRKTTHLGENEKT